MESSDRVSLQGQQKVCLLNNVVKIITSCGDKRQACLLSSIKDGNSISLGLCNAIGSATHYDSKCYVALSVLPCWDLGAGKW